jgi:hypothetical protein
MARPAARRRHGSYPGSSPQDKDGVVHLRYGYEVCKIGSELRPPRPWRQNQGDRHAPVRGCPTRQTSPPASSAMPHHRRSAAGAEVQVGRKIKGVRRRERHQGVLVHPAERVAGQGGTDRRDDHRGVRRAGRKSSSLPRACPSRSWSGGYSAREAQGPPQGPDVHLQRRLIRPSNWRQPSLRVSPERGRHEIPYEDQPTEGILGRDGQLRSPERVSELSVGPGRWARSVRQCRGDAKKLKKQNWVTAEAAFERRKKEKLAAYPELAQRLAVERTPWCSPHFDFFRSTPSSTSLRGSRSARSSNSTSVRRTPDDADQRQLARFVTAKLPRASSPRSSSESSRTSSRRPRRLMSSCRAPEARRGRS